jgi:hypothetical protein
VIFTIYHGPTPPHDARSGYTPLCADRVDGDHIADRQGYAEMRGHYWVWKNYKLRSFVGFQHYRRWLWFDGDTTESHVNDPEEFARYSEADCPPRWIRDYDLVVARPWKFSRDIGREYLVTHVGHHWRAMLAECPDFVPLAKGEHHYNVCNIFVARTELFERYLSFWWDLIQRIERRVLIPDAGYQSRAMSFLSERIFSLWLKRERAKLKVLEVPLIMNLSRKIPDSWEAP